MTLRSFAKINLGLAIGPVRPDGFHRLVTLYQTIDAHDRITVGVEALPGTGTGGEAASGAAGEGSLIELSCTDRRVPVDSRNTVWKMLAMALAVPGRPRVRVRVQIDKRLPIQGGLGAGSANAAAALLGLERELVRQGLAAPLSGEARLALAARVGSDVPLFLLGGTVLGLERGEQVIPLEDLCGAGGTLPVVVALPAVGVSTPAAFRAWDAEQAAGGLTSEAIAGRLDTLSRALGSAWIGEHASGVLPSEPLAHGENRAGTLLSTLVQTGILLNDFEQVVFRQHPLLEQTKRVLASRPAQPSGSVSPGGSSGDGAALYSALSGSGSAVFGLYAQGFAADAAELRLKGLGVRSLRAKVLGRSTYWAEMLAEEHP